MSFKLRAKVKKDSSTAESGTCPSSADVLALMNYVSVAFKLVKERMAAATGGTGGQRQRAAPTLFLGRGSRLHQVRRPQVCRRLFGSAGYLRPSLQCLGGLWAETNLLPCVASLLKTMMGVASSLPVS